MAYIASILFAVGSCCKSINKMRIFMLIGGIIFICLFAMSDLHNSNNLANLLLNCFNVAMHIYNLAKGSKKVLKNPSKNCRMVA